MADEHAALIRDGAAALHQVVARMQHDVAQRARGRGHYFCILENNFLFCRAHVNRRFAMAYRK